MPSTIATTSKIATAAAWVAGYPAATASGLYCVVLNTSDVGLQVMKSTNGTTWTEQDAANSVVNFGTGHAFGYKLHTNGYIYVAYFSANLVVRVRRFNTATDTWEGSDIGGDVNIGVTNSSNVRVAIRSDGDIIVAFKGTGGSAAYSVWEGVSWSAAVAINAGSLVCDAIVDSSDRTWFVFSDTTNNDFSYRNLSSANVLGTLSDFDTNAHATLRSLGSQTSLHSDGTSIYLAVLNRAVGGELRLNYGIPGAAALSSVGLFSTVTTSTAVKETSAGVMARNTGSTSARLYFVWSVANGILYDFTNQSTPTFTLQGADITLLSGLTDADPCPCWIQGGSGYGVVYQDGGAVKVEWIASPSFGFKRSSFVVVA